ncbi:MAG: DUF4389 domain-containing protein [Candidatus Diapherotrites archaeon]
MEAVKVQITPGGKADRAEAIIRIFYSIVLYFIAGILGIVACVLIFINFFTCLILAQRVAADFLAKYIGWLAMIGAYSHFVTDERPPLVP